MPLTFVTNRNNLVLPKVSENWSGYWQSPTALPNLFVVELQVQAPTVKNADVILTAHNYYKSPE